MVLTILAALEALAVVGARGWAGKGLKALWDQCHRCLKPAKKQASEAILRERQLQLSQRDFDAFLAVIHEPFRPIQSGGLSCGR